MSDHLAAPFLDQHAKSDGNIGQELPSFNETSSYDAPHFALVPSDLFNHPGMSIMRLVHLIVVPVLTSAGILGNVLSLIVASRRRRNKYLTSAFAVGLFLVDISHLLSITVLWMQELFPLLTGKVQCQMFNFFNNLTGFLSIWLIVCFSCERFMATCYAFCAARKRLARNKLHVISLLFLFGAIVISAKLWTVDFAMLDGKPVCISVIDNLASLVVITVVENALCFLVPCSLIFFFNGAIIFKYKRSLQQYNKKITRSRSHQTKLKRTLFRASAVFVLLHLPYRICHILNLSMSGSGIITPMFLYIAGEVTTLMFYVSNMSNFLVHTVCGRQIRLAIISLMKKPAGITFAKQNIKTKMIQIAPVSDS